MYKLLICMNSKKVNNELNFLEMASKYFKKIKTTILFSNDINTKIIDYYDIFYTTCNINSESYPFKHVHPNFLINANTQPYNNFHINKIYEKIFKTKLVVYKKDTKAHDSKVFYKASSYQNKPYYILNKPVFTNKAINNIIINSINQAYLAYFIDNKLIYCYHLHSKQDIPATITNSKTTTFFTPKQANIMLRPFAPQIHKMLNNLNVDLCSINFNFKKKIPYIYNINTNPIEPNYYNTAYLDSKLAEHAGKVIERALLSRLKHKAFSN